MGGGAKSTSKPTYTPQQKEVFKWMQGNVVPLAEGKETFMTQLMAQRARDEAARLQGMQQQDFLQAGGITGMSAGQIAQGLQSQQSQALQATLNNIMANRLAMQKDALQMIGNIPIAPGQTTEQRGESPWAKAAASAVGGLAEKGLGALGSKAMQKLSGPGEASVPGTSVPGTSVPGTPTTSTPGTGGGGEVTSEQKKMAMELYRDASPEDKKKMLALLKSQQEGTAPESDTSDATNILQTIGAGTNAASGILSLLSFL